MYWYGGRKQFVLFEFGKLCSCSISITLIKLKPGRAVSYIGARAAFNVNSPISGLFKMVEKPCLFYISAMKRYIDKSYNTTPVPPPSLILATAQTT